MLLGVVLLYVGAVLVINGIWLVGTARAAARLRPATAGGTAEGLITAEEETAADPTFIQNREIAALNIFTGFIGVVAAVTLVIQGNRDEDIASIRAAGYILLFAFTYLWVAYNQFMDVSGHAFGWYCLFVALTAIPAGIYSFTNADGNDASIYLGIDWFAWSVLWFLFFVLLALGRPIARLTGWVAILEGIGTSWVFAILLLQEELMF
jgi:putative amide transporter protein